jgi:hypothetical protein
MSLWAATSATALSTTGEFVRESGVSARTILKGQAERLVERREPGAWAFAWTIWALLSVAAVTFVAQYGTDVPVWDDYAIVSALVGDRQVSPEWLWEQCNEHRIALPKLILFHAERLAGNDVRAGMFLTVSTLIALAAGLLVASSRLEGGIRPSDALFPLLLLNVGQASNFLWSIQFIHVLPTALATTWLILIVSRPTWPTLWMILSTGILMGLLPLCGGTGLMFVPGLALWMLGVAVEEGRSTRPGHRSRALTAALAAVPGLVATAFYFRGFRKEPHPEAIGGILDGGRTAIQFLTGGIGIPAPWLWPWSGAVVLGLTALTLVFLGRAWAFRPGERSRIFGLAAFLAAILALGAAVGWGRGWAGSQAGFQDRYITMATPLFCWLAFGCRLYAPPALGRLVPNALFTALCVVAWPNTQAGIEHGRKGSEQARALTSDLSAGVPAYQIVRRYTPYLHPNQDEIARLMPKLRNARVGSFKALRDSPTFRETLLPIAPSHVSLARWDGNTAHVTGVDSQITFTLARPRPVAGIRISYSHSNGQGAPARFNLTWKRPGQSSYAPAQRYANWNLPTGEGRETTVWIDDVIEVFRIQPDNQPCEFRIDKITILEL